MLMFAEQRVAQKEWGFFAFQFSKECTQDIFTPSFLMCGPRRKKARQNDLLYKLTVLHFLKYF